MPEIDLQEYELDHTNNEISHEELDTSNSSKSYDNDVPAATQIEDLGVQDLGVDQAINAASVRRKFPKLDADKLIDSRRGYPQLVRKLKTIKYRKGDEQRYLEKYVMTYQIWANRLWPKACFDDFVVLTRRAGKDPKMRKFCRDLIEEEKYGGADDLETNHEPKAQTFDQPNRISESDAGSEMGTFHDEHKKTSTTEPENENNPTKSFSANKASSLDTDNSDHIHAVPDQFDWTNEPHDGPNADEIEAAMELYGDLDL